MAIQTSEIGWWLLYAMQESCDKCTRYGWEDTTLLVNNEKEFWSQGQSSKQSQI